MSRRIELGSDAPVGVVLVSFNTREITAQAIYALFRHIKQPAFRLVVVDNASNDGSAELLTALADAGLCDLVLNREQCYHGPALNQGVDLLAARQSSVAPDQRVRFVWVLDSDCIVLRSETLSAAVNLMTTTGAGLVGQWAFDAWHDGETMGLHCLLLDPEQVWRAGIARFEEDGEPSRHLQRSAIESGVGAAELPFTRDGYVVHLGRSTLSAVARRGDRENRYFAWATGHHEPHFMNEPTAPERYAAFLRAFTADVGEQTTSAIVAACLRHGQPPPGP